MKQGKKQKAEFSLDGLLKNPVSVKQLTGFIEEIMLCKVKMQQDSEAIKDIRNEAKDSLGVPGKILNKLVKERMNAGSIESEVHDLDEVQQIAAGLGMTDPV
jgi:uncharacterized protein (UPF0335 family)